MKLTVLGEATGREPFRLVHDFSVSTRRRFRTVMSLIDQGSTAVLDPVAIWSVWTERHKDYGVIPSHAKIHSLLETGALAAAHFDVGDYIVTHGLFHDAERLG